MLELAIALVVIGTFWALFLVFVAKRARWVTSSAYVVGRGDEIRVSEVVQGKRLIIAGGTVIAEHGADIFAIQDDVTGQFVQFDRMGLSNRQLGGDITIQRKAQR